MSNRRSHAPELRPAPTGSGPVPAACAGDVCITCSDEAVQVRVVELLPGRLARVDTGHSTEEVSVALVDAAVGDLVLVHAQEAIALLPGSAG